MFGLAAASIVTFYGVSQREVGGRWWARLRDLPAMVALGLGLSVNNAVAVVEALSGSTGEFRRTPKYGVRSQGDPIAGGGRRRGGGRLQPLVEIAFGAYFTLAVGYAVAAGVYGAVPVLALFQAGFLYAGFASRAPRYETGPAGDGPAGGGAQ